MPFIHLHLWHFKFYIKIQSLLIHFVKLPPPKKPILFWWSRTFCNKNGIAFICLFARNWSLNQSETIALAHCSHWCSKSGHYKVKVWWELCYQGFWWSKLSEVFGWLSGWICFLMYINFLHAPHIGLQSTDLSQNWVGGKNCPGSESASELELVPPTQVTNPIPQHTYLF